MGTKIGLVEEAASLEQAEHAPPQRALEAVHPVCRVGNRYVELLLPQVCPSSSEIVCADVTSRLAGSSTPR